MKQYLITLETIKHPKDGDIEKYFIHYLEGGEKISTEFYSKDLNNPMTEIKQGYTKHPDSL